MRFRCIRCAPVPKGWLFESDAGVCPRCGAHGGANVHPIVDVHLVVFDQKGPISGHHGRQYVACQPARQMLGAHMLDTFAATGDPRAVTCRSCIGTDVWRQMAKEYAEIQAIASGGVKIDGAGNCCG